MCYLVLTFLFNKTYISCLIQVYYDLTSRIQVFTIAKMMPTLQYLSLSKNNLVGSIPLLFCEMQNLHILDFFENHFSGEIPDCLMKAKDVVNLGNNNFSGRFRMLSKGHCSLQLLHLDSNKLHGILPYSLSRCTNMSLLDLGENKFTGHIPSWIAKCMLSLKFLRLRSNKFSGNIPPSLLRLKSLQLLDLANNSLSYLNQYHTPSEILLP